MEATPDTVFILRHREHRKGARWRKVASVATHPEAVALIVGRGDWHIHEQPAERNIAPNSTGTESDQAQSPR